MRCQVFFSPFPLYILIDLECRLQVEYCITKNFNSERAYNWFLFNIFFCEGFSWGFSFCHPLDSEWCRMETCCLIMRIMIIRMLTITKITTVTITTATKTAKTTVKTTTITNTSRGWAVRWKGFFFYQWDKFRYLHQFIILEILILIKSCNLSLTEDTVLSVGCTLFK